MSILYRLAVVLLALTAWLVDARTGSALAARSKTFVQDQAGLFDPAVINSVNQELAQTDQQYHEDLVVESFAAIPAVKEADERRLGKKEFFAEWARERAKALQVTGVYVLICKHPGHLQVEVGNETRKRAFTLANRDQLVQILDRRFEAGQFNEGLQQGTAYFRQSLQANLGTGRPAAGGDGNGKPHKGWSPLGGGLMGLVCIGLAVLAVIWVIMGIVRAASAARGGNGPGPGPGYGPGYGPAPGFGGGGFMPGLLGGLFGAAAGNWMYDRFFRGDSGPGYGGGWGSAPAPGAGQPVDTDYSGAGADFGDSGTVGDTSGGADFGGGSDFGGRGGDLDSGGDFGGGGGDYSGGGADF